MAVWLILQIRFTSQRKKMMQITILLLTIVSLCLCVFYSQFSARGGIVNYNRMAKDADTERLIYQKIAWEMVKQRPFLGVGLNNFQVESHRFFPKGCELPSKVHNIYLLIAAETGLIGMSSFLLFIFSLLKKARSCIQTQEGILLLSLFLGFLFIGMCDFYFISTPHGQILFFGFAALLHCRSIDTSHSLKKRSLHASI